MRFWFIKTHLKEILIYASQVQEGGQWRQDLYTSPALHHGRGFPPFHFCGVYSDMQPCLFQACFMQVWTLLNVHKLASEEKLWTSVQNSVWRNLLTHKVKVSYEYCRTSLTCLACSSGAAQAADGGRVPSLLGRTLARSDPWCSVTSPVSPAQPSPAQHSRPRLTLGKGQNLSSEMRWIVTGVVWFYGLVLVTYNI